MWFSEGYTVAQVLFYHEKKDIFEYIKGNPIFVLFKVW